MVTGKYAFRRMSSREMVQDIGSGILYSLWGNALYRHKTSSDRAKAVRELITGNHVGIGDWGL